MRIGGRGSLNGICTGAIAALSALIVLGTAHAAVPAFKFGQADLLNPSGSVVTNYYGTSTTHTNGVNSARSEEIKSLAKALNYDPDLIFEYVHDNIAYYPTFGLSKGALGAHLDKSGTSFDQAHLLAELLSEAAANGASVSNIQFKYGTLSFNSGQVTEVTSWIGETDAGALCRLLGNGGIPGSVNGTTDTNCSGLSGSITSLVIAHVWVTATVSGNSVTYDPAYKTHTEVAPLSVSSTNFMGVLSGASCANGEALTAALPSETGTASGSSYAKTFNDSALQSHLNSCATTLWDWIEANKQDASLEEIIGGRKIVPRTPGTFALSSGHYSTTYAWSSIPDQYRVKLSVEITDTNFSTTIDLYADEIAGHRVALEPNGFKTNDSFDDLPYIPTRGGAFQWIVRLTVDGVPVSGKGFQGYAKPFARGIWGTYSINMPYAASSGTYQDSSFNTDGWTIATLSAITLSTGDSSSQWARQYLKGLGLDRPNSLFGGKDPGYNGGSEWQPPWLGPGPAAEKIRYRVFAAWAEQFTRVREIATRVASAKAQHHYTFGLSYGATLVRLYSESCMGYNGNCSFSSIDAAYAIDDEATTMTLQTGMSTTQTGSGAIGLRRSLANVAAALESSVMEQQLDSTAPAGTAQKFRWANLTSRSANPSGNGTASEPQGAFPIYEFTSGANLGVLTSNGVGTCSPGPMSQYDCLEAALTGSIQSYLSAGYTVVSAGDAYLGPGLHNGTFYSFSGQQYPNSNLARGGAFIAYDTDYMNVAFVSHAALRMSKGGAAGPSAPGDLQGLAAPTAADLLKQQEKVKWAHNVDLKTGTLTYAPDALISAGHGDFPYGLAFSRNMSTGDSSATEPMWKHNWDMQLTVSGSGNETMGASRGLFASATIAAVVALKGLYAAAGQTAAARIEQETTGALAAAWWTDRLTYNVVSASFGGSTQQFVRKLATNTFYPAAGGAARVTQSGSRYQGPPGYWWMGSFTANETYLTLKWNYDTLSFTLTNPNKDQIAYGFWGTVYDEPWESSGNDPKTPHEGFRATSWAFPFGITVSLTYGIGNCYTYDNALCGRPSLTSVANGLGRSLSFTGWLANPTAVTNDAGQSVSLADGQVTHIDGKVTTFTTHTTNINNYKAAQYLDAVKDPGYSSANHTFAYDATGRAVTYTNALGQAWTYRAAGERRGAVLDPSGDADVTYFDDMGRAIRSIDRRNYVTTTDYDGIGRATSTKTRYGGDAANTWFAWKTFAYDDAGNVLQEVTHTRTKDFSTGQSFEAYDSTNYRPLVVVRTYDSQCRGLMLTESDSHKDNAGSWTTLVTQSVNQTKCQVTRVQGAGTDGTNERQDVSWTYGTSGGATGQIIEETKTLTASTTRVTTFAYDTKGQMVSRAVDPSGLNIVSKWQYDSAGNITQTWDPNVNAATGSPSADQGTSATYDSGDRLASIRVPAIGGSRGGADYAYNTKGQLVSLQALKPGGGYATSTIAYSATGRPTSVTDPSSHATAFEYDSEDRLSKVTDADGKNTAYEYWPDNKVEKIKKAVGTSLEQTYARMWYDFAGRKLAQRPARGNVGTGNTTYDTNYGFDEYSRPAVTYFPDATQESVVYNPNGTVQYKRTRNVANPSGGDHNDIKFEYDASQRLVRQYEYWTNRSPTVRNDKKTTYDLAGRVTCQWMVGATDGCNGASPARVEYAYDKADRLTEEKQDGRAVGTTYDAAGNRTGITWPDGKAAAYSYTARNELGSVSFESVTLAAYSYDIQGRATGATFGNGNSAGVTHEVDDDLSALEYALKDEAGAAQALKWEYAYTNAHRLQSQTVSVPAHDWSPPANMTTTYTAPSMAPALPNEAANKVDQYEAVAEEVNHSGSPVSAALSYDVRGNLVADGTWVYTYDLENRMAFATASGTSCSSGCSYTYDPMGRRVSKTVGSTVTKFLRAGPAEIAEYDSGGTLLRRYVPGAGPDAFVVWIEGTGTTSASMKWILADRQGSVAVVTDSNGKATQRFAYDPFGNQTTPVQDGFPFRYTGQRFDPETGLYYYKARYYSAKLGRFLQTDPIGYEDQLNLYTYVDNNPANKTDPTGEYGRGEGWKDDQWKKFDAAQKDAASRQDKRANQLEAQADKKEKDGDKAGADRLRAKAATLREGAKALRSDGSDGYKANAVGQKEYQEKHGGSPNGMAITSEDGKTLTVNTDNKNWDIPDLARWTVAHESLHSAGLRDQKGSNGALAYKRGDDDNKAAFRELRGTAKGDINPDNILDEFLPCAGC